MNDCRGGKVWMPQLDCAERIVENEVLPVRVKSVFQTASARKKKRIPVCKLEGFLQRLIRRQLSVSTRLRNDDRTRQSANGNAGRKRQEF